MRHKHSLSFFLILLCSGGNVARAASIAGNIKIDHFGYRTGDVKIAYFTANPGASVQLHDSSSNALVYTTTNITSLGPDTSSPLIYGDSVWWVDFSPFTTAGRYYLLSPSLSERSYDFNINDSVYQSPMAATLKALYYQRCGTPKASTYAGVWSDGTACHLQDRTATAIGGCTFPKNYGTLDLSGGYHDAGDYNKYMGTPPSSCATLPGDSGHSVQYLLTAYEWNPANFPDGLSNIPESGNGISDLLDAAKWELDWYLKMQMVDKHVLSIIRQTSSTTAAPPSTDTVTRCYYPPNPDSEGEFVALLSHAARVMASISGLQSYATTLRTAAEATWTAWVQPGAASEYRFWAAAEIFRMEQVLGGSSTIESQAQAIVDGYQTWSTYTMTVMTKVNPGMIAYVQAPNATSSVVSAMNADLSSYVNTIFSLDDRYHSGMNSGDYYWGSNQVKMQYGIDLLWAAKLGTTGTHTPAQCVSHAEDFLHYMNGTNPMNMVYMTNADALGAKHGVWRMFHGWFGNWWNSWSETNFTGPPAGYVDPLWPYFSGTDNFGQTDTSNSTYGPPPGLVPDGPTYQYHDLSGKSIPPLLAGGAQPPYARAYRDWNFQDPTGSQTIPWVVNENGIYYITSYLALSSGFVATNSAPNPPIGLVALAH